MKLRKEVINMNYFVGGYYDDRIFKGEEFDGKTPFGKDIDIYTLEEVLKLGFVENVKDIYDWEELSEQEKINAILDYTGSDEIAGLIWCENKEVAEKCKQEILEDVEELEKNIEYVGKEQDEYGIFREVYISKC